MRKREYNHEVGNVYLALEDLSYFGGIIEKRYYLRLLVQKKIINKKERYGMFSISIHRGGKFKIATSWIARPTLNNFARKCVIREKFEAEGHRLGFLVLTGATLEGIIEKAIERYQKNVKHRYSVKWNPDEVKSLLKYVEPS